MSDKYLRDTFTSFDPRRSQSKDLPATAEKPDLPGGLGVGRDPTAKKSGTDATGGIASPLTEVANSRVYQAGSTNWVSGDGLLLVVRKKIKTVKMTDANGRVVIMEYAA